MSSNTNKEEKKCVGCGQCDIPEFVGRECFCTCHAPQPEKQDVPSPNPLEEDIICKCSHYHSQHSKLTTFNPNYTAGTCKMNCRCKYFVHDPDYPQAPNCEHKGKCVDGSAMGCSEWEMSIYYKK